MPPAHPTQSTPSVPNPGSPGLPPARTPVSARRHHPCPPLRDGKEGFQRAMFQAFIGQYRHGQGHSHAIVGPQGRLASLYPFPVYVSIDGIGQELWFTEASSAGPYPSELATSRAMRLHAQRGRFANKDIPRPIRERFQSQLISKVYHKTGYSLHMPVGRGIWVSS